MQTLLVIQGKRKSAASPMVTINAVRNTYTLASDVATLLERAANETIPAFRDDKPADSLAARHAQVEHTICKSTALRSDVSLPVGWIRKGCKQIKLQPIRFCRAVANAAPIKSAPDWHLFSRLLPDPARSKLLALPTTAGSLSRVHCCCAEGSGDG